MNKWIFWAIVAVLLILWVNFDPASFHSAVNALASGLGQLIGTVLWTVTAFVISLLAGPRGDASPILAIIMVAILVMAIVALKKKIFGGGGGGH